MTLPTFLIIGAQRSASTSIHYSLMRHGQIFMSRRKEVDYFLRGHDGVLPKWMDPEDAKRVPLTRAGYEALFDEAGPQHLAVGESSPSYLSAAVAPRIFAELPNVRLIVILRHPVDQARSILSTWLRRPPNTAELITWLSDNNRPGPRGEPPLVTHGRYIHHLHAYFRKFDRNQIKVVLFEDLTEHRQMVLGEIQAFLGVQVDNNLPLLHLNATGRPRSKALAALLGDRAKQIARAIFPQRALRPLVPHLHKLQSANTKIEETLDPTLRKRLFEEHYLSSTLQLALLLPHDMLKPWLGEADKARSMA